MTGGAPSRPAGVPSRTGGRCEGADRDHPYLTPSSTSIVSWSSRS